LGSNLAVRERRIAIPSGRWTPVVVSRIAAAFALAVVVGLGFYFGVVSPSLGPPEPSAQQLVTWTMAHQQQQLFQFVPAYVALLYAVLVALLVHLTGGRGVLASLAYIGAGANLSVALVGFGLFFGLWTYIQRGGSDDGIIALATIAPTFTHSQLIALGLAIGCVGLLGLRSRAWPAWLSWLLIVTGAEHVLTSIAFASFPDFSTTTSAGTFGGLARVTDIALGYLWLIATLVVLLVRPVRQVRGEVGEVLKAAPIGS
jgi:hypothetical protein